MQNRRAWDIAHGGACTFQLPPDPRIASIARSHLTDTMRQLVPNPELIDCGALAVSELATNAQCHADPRASNTRLELWIWALTCPAPQLIVSVFDGDREAFPERPNDGPLEEGGRGLAIVEAVTNRWGANLSRSRCSLIPTAGKSAWFALRLPEPWPWTDLVIAPAFAAQRLLLGLGSRGINAARHRDAIGRTRIRVDDLNILVEPRYFSWRGSNGAPARYPLIDLQEATEQVVRHLEERRRQ
jgi:anti-sigma regulatory factor (Ser/Thr protein kinase)